MIVIQITKTVILLMILNDRLRPDRFNALLAAICRTKGRAGSGFRVGGERKGEQREINDELERIVEGEGSDGKEKKKKAYQRDSLPII